MNDICIILCFIFHKRRTFRSGICIKKLAFCALEIETLLDWIHLFINFCILVDYSESLMVSAFLCDMVDGLSGVDYFSASSIRALVQMGVVKCFVL